MSQHKNNPQLEDGFTRIANELLEAISTFGFSQRELSVLLAIIRKTYGYGKKTDDMSASQLTALCNVPRQHVTTTLLSLANRNVISKIPGRFGSIIGIQKNHKKWIAQDIFKGRLASPELGRVDSPDLGQGCPEAGQGDERNGNSENSPDDNLETAAQPTLLLDSHSPMSGHPSPELGHVPNWVFASPDLGHTKENQQKKEIHMSGSPDVIEILDYLNLKAGRRYRPVKVNLKFISDRLAESSLIECKAVIDAKVAEWLDDPRMSQYLRPETLFGATKFAQYVGQLGSGAEKDPFL